MTVTLDEAFYDSQPHCLCFLSVFIPRLLRKLKLNDPECILSVEKDTVLNVSVGIN